MRTVWAVLVGTSMVWCGPTTRAEGEKEIQLDIQARAGQGRPQSSMGTAAVQFNAFELPVSNLLTLEEQSAIQRASQRDDEVWQSCVHTTAIPYWADAGALPEIRRCLNQRYYQPRIAELRTRYDVRIEPRMLGGVGVEVVSPAEGVASRNRVRVLINLHGGGFAFGSRSLSQVESIPIAALGEIKVVSVDYRMSPEHKFPAASEDASAVYRDLLKEYKPRNIGIYGCSAGGLLTAQTVAWLQKENLPMPGAIGMFCAGANYWAEGDTGYYQYARAGAGSRAKGAWQEHPYFKDSDQSDPLVFPVYSRAVMARFPPSLLIASTRDVALSSVVDTHARLVALGVEAELHVWEGVGHAFFMNAALPQSREAYATIVKFFDAHLAKE